MTRKLFGTDGVRGQANTHPMTPDVVLKLAVATGQHFRRGDHRHLVVIGKDTRLSGYMIEPALTSGFISVGMDVMLVGPMPTPAIAMLTRSLRADLGVVISASHNPYEDNGIKFFGPDGYKLSDIVEKKIETQALTDDLTNLTTPSNLGRAWRLEDAPGRYIEFVKSTFPKKIRLDGLKIVVDCANGAAYKVAPTVFWELGADIIPIGIDPDGCNINLNCGATATEAMRHAVIEHKADIGISLDGDADRVLISDENGTLVNGDQLLALIATSWRNLDKLQGDGIVGTVMSNMGLENYLQSHGMKLHRTSVGDRYVSAYMREHDYNLGGEQSGHIIMNDYITTGDGLIGALQILSVLVQSGKPASDLCRMFEPTPQVLKNVKIHNANPIESPRIQGIISQIENDFGDKARLLVRKSGTEPLLRIMAEGEDRAMLEQTVDSLIEAINEEMSSAEASLCA